MELGWIWQQEITHGLSVAWEVIQEAQRTGNWDDARETFLQYLHRIDELLSAFPEVVEKEPYRTERYAVMGWLLVCNVLYGVKMHRTGEQSHHEWEAQRKIWLKEALLLRADRGRLFDVTLTRVLCKMDNMLQNGGGDE
jgi:hypothetical protein